MDRTKKITYFGIILTSIVSALFYLLLITDIHDEKFLIPATSFGILAAFMNGYRTAYLKNKFEPIISKIEAVALTFLILPLTYLWIYPLLAYGNPPFAGLSSEARGLSKRQWRFQKKR